jgi:plastocyanin
VVMVTEKLSPSYAVPINYNQLNGYNTKQQLDDDVFSSLSRNMTSATNSVGPNFTTGDINNNLPNNIGPGGMNDNDISSGTQHGSYSSSPGMMGPGTPYHNLITNTTLGTKTPPGTIVSIVKNAAQMTDKAYQPNPINIKVGDTITWINRDSVMHTVTSGPGLNDPNEGKEFDSGLLTQGGIFAHTFKTAGVFNYFCAPHPWMVAKVIVR